MVGLNSSCGPDFSSGNAALLQEAAIRVFLLQVHKVSKKREAFRRPWAPPPHQAGAASRGSRGPGGPWFTGYLLWYLRQELEGVLWSHRVPGEAS